MKLHPYQIKAYEFGMNTPRCGLFMEMGLGKTITTLKIIRDLMYKELEINKVLIIGPKRVIENVWEEENTKWGIGLKISKVSGDAKKRAEALRKKADVYLLGRDNIEWFYNQGIRDFDLLIIDESTSFKNPKSKRFKIIRKLWFDRVILLSGTPSPNGLEDLWSQIYLLDRGERLEKYITRFRKLYFSPALTNGYVVYKYTLKPGADKIIMNKIRDITLSIKAVDVLPPTEVLINDIFISLGDFKPKYEEYVRERIIEFKGKELTAVNAAVLTGKLLQFCNGNIYGENRETIHIHNIKLDAIKEILENASGNILLAYNFIHDKKMILKEIPEAEEFDINKWNSGKQKLALLHPKSGGHGLNLQKGGYTIIWFGLTWDLEIYEQFNARLARQGQEHPVVIHRIISRDTIEEKLIKSLQKKTKIQEILKDYLR